MYYIVFVIIIIFNAGNTLLCDDMFENLLRNADYL